MIFVQQMPLVDTKSCTAHFRTNSFVGTEGESDERWILPCICVLIIDGGHVRRVYCTGSHR
jgi:hypothetical protein